jgi:hypothetical protein
VANLTNRKFWNCPRRISGTPDTPLVPELQNRFLRLMPEPDQRCAAAPFTSIIISIVFLPQTLHNAGFACHRVSVETNYTLGQQLAFAVVPGILAAQ